MSGELEGHVILVSGGAQGLGASHARHIVGAGGRVIIADVQDDKAGKLAAELGEAAFAVRLDVTEPDSWQRTVERGEEALGGITGLVNNAGVFGEGDTESVRLEEFRHVHRINVDGVLLGIQAVVPSLRAAGGGSIVNVSSIAGLIGIQQHPSYVSSKWAVRGLTKAAALDLGPHGIRVNSVHPGRIATSFTAGLDSPILPNQVIRDPGRPGDVSPLVVYLLSDASRFSTGSEFVVDGGRYLGEYRHA